MGKIKRKKRKFKPRKFYRLNQNIKAAKVRLVIGKESEVVPFAEALKRAQEAESDLVEVAGKVDPPICKIIDFKKFMYQQKRKQEKASKSKIKEQKDFIFGPTISENDLNIRIERARKFLKNKEKVKLTVKFFGRQVTHPEVGRAKLEKAIDELSDMGAIDRPIRLEAKLMGVILKPR